MKRPTKAQVTALAWAVYRGGEQAMLRSMEFHFLDIRDATVAALEAAGWADRTRYYDDARKWRWWWFFVTPAGKALPAVVAEVERLRKSDLMRAKRDIAEDDAGESS